MEGFIKDAITKMNVWSGVVSKPISNNVLKNGVSRSKLVIHIEAHYRKLTKVMLS